MILKIENILIRNTLYIQFLKNSYKNSSMSSTKSQSDMVSPDIQILHRLDKLQFSRWHLFMVLSLGLVWIFDGYEVSLISLFRKYIVEESDESTFKSLATAYQVGCIVGSLIFGILGFTLGRKKIFIITLVIYAFGILFSIISKSYTIFILGRFLTGVRYLCPYISIGGEFTAIFTAIDEFLPPKYRGRVNIGIDGTWHLGGSFAAVLNMLLGEVTYWRYLFAIGLGGVFALGIMRKSIPQSPRWLILKNKNIQADIVVKSIEYAVSTKKIFLQPPINYPASQLDNVQNQLVSQRSEIEHNSLDKHSQALPKQVQQTLSQVICFVILTIFQAIKQHKTRFFLAFFLMFTQAFFFNLVYYKFPATLENVYKLSQDQIGLYMLPLALSSFVSTLVIGPLFDKIGRRHLLLVTYSVSGILLMCSEAINQLIWLQILICLMFVFTSPAGSSANLIASEIFPTSSRTLVLFIMFIIGMVGGIMGVWVETVWLGSVLMIIAGIIGFFLCPKSQNKSLQQIQSM